MKKLLVMVLSVTMLLGLIGCGQASSKNGGAASDAKITIKISCSVSPDHECYQRLVDFGEKVNADCDDAFNFEIYPNDQLGDYNLVTEELIRGNVEMLCGSINTGVDTRFDLAFTPYLAPTLEDAKEVFAPDSFIYNKLASFTDELGLHLLGFDVIGMAALCFGNKAPADCFAIGGGENMMVRSPGNEHTRTFLSEMGYNPTTVNWSEVYSSIQTGVIDGFLGANASTAYLQFRDVIKTFIALNIWTEIQYVMVSPVVWDKLTDEQKASFETHGKELFLESIEQTQASDGEYLKKLAENNVTILYPTDDEMAAITKMAREKAWPAAESRLGTELYHELLDEYGIA